MSAARWIEIGRMDELGRLESPAHRLDARAKALATLAFVGVVMSFPRYEIAALTPFFLYPMVLMSLGGIPAGVILRRLLIAAPFAVVVGLFNPLLDRQPVTAIGSFVITGGWLSFASILIRFALTVGAALALVACTGMIRLSAGLARLGVPRVFVVQLLFLYRYLFVVSDEGATMMRGVELRTAGRSSLSLRTYGPLLGTLLIRSMDRAERVYRAMIARGFDGEIRDRQTARFRWTDWGFLLGWCAFFAAARRWNIGEELGRLLTGGLS